MPDIEIHRGRFLAFVERDGWEFVRRTQAQAVAVIAAATDAAEMVLIEQRRRPLGEQGEPVIELPAGLVGDDGVEDDLLSAAQRELIEETGFAAEEIRVVTHGPSSAGLTDEIVTLLVACGLRRVGEGGGIGDEDIQIHLVPLSEADAWLERRHADGVLIDPKVWAGLHLLARGHR